MKGVFQDFFSTFIFPKPEKYQEIDSRPAVLTHRPLRRLAQPQLKMAKHSVYLKIKMSRVGPVLLGTVW